MTEWEALLTRHDYSQIALELIHDCDAFDFEALRTDAYDALSRYAEIEINLRGGLTYGCGGGGYYRPKPPTIYLHPSILRRDSFTLLHELGHHLQITHPQWGFVLLDLPRVARRRTEEEVCDQIASQVLMPWQGGTLVAHECHPADLMAGLFESSNASRTAAMMRVRKLFPDSAKWILAVAELDGRVQSSSTTYSDPHPAKDSVQPGFAALAMEAESGPVRRTFSEGIVYGTGSVLEEMRAEAVLDYEGRYVFVALTPVLRFGTGRIGYPTYDCSNLACGRTFETRYSPNTCEQCGEPRCPDCRSCGCELPGSAKPCPSCFVVMSPGEIANQTHECW